MREYSYLILDHARILIRNTTTRSIIMVMREYSYLILDHARILILIRNTRYLSFANTHT